MTRFDDEVGGQSEVGSLRRVLLKHPKDTFAGPGVIESQWTDLNYLRAPDLEGAMAEHDALGELLERFGAQVDYLPSNPDTGMDSIYARDAALMTDQGAILCHMGKAARSGEPGAQGTAYEALGIPVHGKISGAGRLEGGDFLWLDEGTAVVGRGYRTNDEGIEQLAGLLEDTALLPTVDAFDHGGPGAVRVVGPGVTEVGQPTQAGVALSTQSHEVVGHWISECDHHVKCPGA